MSSKIVSILLGFFFAFIIVALAEVFFRAIRRFEPVSLTQAFSPPNCAQKPKPTAPYWLGIPLCAVKSALQKQDSKQVVFDVTYNFDAHGLRRIPAAKKNDRFLLFLGCSYTYGEGQNDADTFANGLTSKMGPVNAFNLGMAGYGPNQTLQLLLKEDDIRTAAIHGREGLAIYTYIDDHFRRVLGSVSWMRVPAHKEAPYFYLDQDVLKSGGTFSSGRPFWTWVYRIMSLSKTLSFFNVEMPRVDDEEIKLFAEIILRISEIAKNKHHVEKFIFSIYPGNRLYASKLKPLLEKSGVIVFDFSGIDPGETLHGGETLPGDEHPSKLAHEFYSDLLRDEMRLRKIQFN